MKSNKARWKLWRVALVAFPGSATSQETTPCSIKPASCTSHAAVKLCNAFTHLEQEGANNKLIDIWGLPWRGNFCSRKTGTVICPWKGWNASSGLKDYCSALSVEAAGAPLSFTSPSPGGDLIPEISASLSSPSPASLSPRCWRLATCTKRVPLRQGSTLLRSDEQMLSPCQPGTWGDAAQLACADEGWKGFL